MSTETSITNRQNAEPFTGLDLAKRAVVPSVLVYQSQAEAMGTL
ncbi:hypothetical protein [Deinococcus sp. UYEF24]